MYHTNVGYLWEKLIKALIVGTFSGYQTVGKLILKLRESTYTGTPKHGFANETNICMVEKIRVDLTYIICRYIIELRLNLIIFIMYLWFIFCNILSG